MFMGHNKLTCGTRVACNWTTLVYFTHNCKLQDVATTSAEWLYCKYSHTHLQLKERGQMNSSALNIQTQPSNGATTGRNGSCLTVSTAVTLFVTFPVSYNLFPSQVHFNFRVPKVIIFFAINCCRHSAWWAAILQNQILGQNLDLLYMPLHRTSSNFLPDKYWLIDWLINIGFEPLRSRCT